MKPNKYRIPRPIGITQLMIEYHKTQDKSILDSITTQFIQQWLINNGSVCGRNFSADQLCQFLHCDSSRIRSQMRDSLLVNSKIWDKDKQEELMNALIGQQIMWAMEDRMDISHQVEILRTSQGNKYMPFITTELNKALGLKQSSSNTLNSIFRSLSGGGSINIFNNVENKQQVNQITVEEALQLISEENKRLPVHKEEQGLLFPNEVAYIEAHHDIESLPEVQADKQVGVDTSKEGLHITKEAISQVIDDYKGALRESDEAHHEIRREIELSIDRDAIDPELSIYPA